MNFKNGSQTLNIRSILGLSRKWQPFDKIFSWTSKTQMTSFYLKISVLLLWSALMVVYTL